jgi:SAM-dependent methyltransferase
VPGTEPDVEPPFDTSVAHPARIYDYWLGGKDNFAADRAAGDQVIALRPEIIPGVRANRRFLGRAVSYLAAEEGIRQFLDIGTGLPRSNNTHEVAQSEAPDSRVVYVDNDPIVLAHARALLVSTRPGKTAYIGGDLRDTSMILAKAGQTLDFGQPVAVMFLMTLQYIPDSDDPHAIVRTYLDACAPGSFLVVADTTNEAGGPALAEGTRRMNEGMGGAVTQTRRPAAQVGQYFEGLQLVEPGLISTHRWRPGPGEPDTENDWPVRCGVGRKP